jgi:hypothetical protein
VLPLQASQTCGLIFDVKKGTFKEATILTKIITPVLGL